MCDHEYIPPGLGVIDRIRIFPQREVTQIIKELEWYSLFGTLILYIIHQHVKFHHASTKGSEVIIKTLNMPRESNSKTKAA